MAGRVRGFAVEEVVRVKAGQLHHAFEPRLLKKVLGLRQEIQVLVEVPQRAGEYQQRGGNVRFR